jgi:DNA-dependent RNA polymerase auxiliary subunit epsilon
VDDLQRPYRGRRRTRTAETSLTDTEIIQAQHDAIQALQKRVKRLSRRLLEKKKYEIEFLKIAGASADYLNKINQKDEAALREG